MTADNLKAIAGNDQEVDASGSDQENVTTSISDSLSQNHTVATQEEPNFVTSSEGGTLHLALQFDGSEALNEEDLATLQEIQDEITRPQATEHSQEMNPFHLQSHPQQQVAQESFTSTSQGSYETLTEAWNGDLPPSSTNSAHEISNASQYFQGDDHYYQSLPSSDASSRNVSQSPLFHNPFYQSPLSQGPNQNNYYAAQPFGSSLNQAHSQPFGFSQTGSGYSQSQQTNPFMHQQSGMMPQQPRGQQSNMMPQPYHQGQQCQRSLDHYEPRGKCGKGRKRQKRNEERRHICEACSKGFLRPSSLSQHRVVHTHEKPYQCPVEICPRHRDGNWFSVKSNMMRHLRKVHKKKASKEPCDPCQCPACIPRQWKDHDEDGSGSPPPSCAWKPGPWNDGPGGTGEGAGATAV